MDGRFLSQPKVIEASRHFVCIRLLTYESKEEAKVIKSVFIGRSGDLENTVFALLTPEGETVGRAGRSPEQVFEGPEALAAEMDRVAKAHPAKKGFSHELPVAKNIRLALNVAACDRLPLVVALHPQAEGLAKIEKTLNAAAWKEGVQGAFTYAVTSEAKELASVQGLKAKSGILVIEPDAFGLKGTMLAEIPADASVEKVEQGLLKARALHDAPPKDTRKQIEEARRTGIHWETEIPDTDPGPGPGRGAGSQQGSGPH